MDWSDKDEPKWRYKDGSYTCYSRPATQSPSHSIHDLTHFVFFETLHILTTGLVLFGPYLNYAVTFPWFILKYGLIYCCEVSCFVCLCLDHCCSQDLRMVRPIREVYSVYFEFYFLWFEQSLRGRKAIRLVQDIFCFYFCSIKVVKCALDYS